METRGRGEAITGESPEGMLKGSTRKLAGAWVF
jgi:hypothetical protein